MSDIEFGTWKNELLKLSLFTIRHRNEFWFIGKEAAKCFGYTRTTYAIKERVFYDYKLTLEDFYSKMISIDSSFVEKFKTAYFREFQIWPKKSLILTNELGFYQLANGAPSKDLEPFQRWVFETIREIRDKGYYCLPELKNLSLEDRKKTTEYVVKHDIPDFVFIHPCGNLERKKYRDLLKEGYDKSKYLIQVNLGSIGGKKSAKNTQKARDFCKYLSKEDEEDFLRLSKEELYNYIRDLIRMSKSIVKDFKT